MSQTSEDRHLPAAMPGGVSADLRAWLGPVDSQPGTLRWGVSQDAAPPQKRRVRAGRLQLSWGASRRELDQAEAELQARMALFQAIRIPIKTPAVITLGSGFGGQGKTMIAAALCIIFAMLRIGERVIGLDVNADMGNLLDRLGGDLSQLPEEFWPITMRAFFQQCQQGNIQSYTTVRDLVAWLQNCAVIRGDEPDARLDNAFGAGEYKELLGYVQTLFTIIVNDGGTKLLDDLHTGALRTTHQYIFVAEPTRLGIKSVMDALRFYDGLDTANFQPLMSHTIAVLNKFNEADENDCRWRDQLAADLADTGITLLTVPWDFALKDRSDTLNLSNVQPATLHALLQLAAAVLRGINCFDREVGDPTKASQAPKGAASVIPPPAQPVAAETPTGDYYGPAVPSAAINEPTGNGWPASSSAAYPSLSHPAQAQTPVAEAVQPLLRDTGTPAPAATAPDDAVGQPQPAAAAPATVPGPTTAANPLVLDPPSPAAAAALEDPWSFEDGLPIA